jgi:Tfp pilus assembly protein FimT
MSHRSKNSRNIARITDSPSSGGEGFTLLEMMIVLFIIMVVMGISMVFFAGMMRSARLNASARELSAAVRYAHKLSLSEGSRKVLVIDLDEKKYGIEGHFSKNLDSSIVIRVSDPVSGEVGSGTYSFVFQPTGVGQGGTILLSSGKKETRIQLDPIIGSVVIN